MAIIIHNSPRIRSVTTPPHVLDFKAKALDGGFCMSLKARKGKVILSKDEELCPQEVILPTTGRLGSFLDVVYEGQTARENPKHHHCLSSKRARGRRG